MTATWGRTILALCRMTIAGIESGIVTGSIEGEAGVLQDMLSLLSLLFFFHLFLVSFGAQKTQKPEAGRQDSLVSGGHG